MDIPAPGRLPPGLRIYAIGDVHGCLEQLVALQAVIAQDWAARPAQRCAIVYLGDYVDRGPDSAGVLALLSAAGSPVPQAELVSLIGNHEEMMLAALRAGPGTVAEDTWLWNGGDATLASYGGRADLPAPVSPTPRVSVLRAPILRALVPRSPVSRSPASSSPVSQPPVSQPPVPQPPVTQPPFPGAPVADPPAPGPLVLPPLHLAWLQGLRVFWQAGDYLFVHAGIDPRRALEEQRRVDMLWIREPFLSWPRPLPAVVVHGHTPSRLPELRTNRIGIDTGAVAGGRLTCLALDEATLRFLQV